MSKVFIVNQPDETRTPGGQKIWDVSPAELFGEITYVFTADQPPPSRNREEAIEQAHDKLSEAVPGDFLVWAGGDPFGMIVAAGIMADYTGGEFYYLMWDRKARSYAPVKVDLFNGDDNE